MAETVLSNVLEFFRTLGVYDVILPFLLTFTVVFAILERTKVLGTEGEKAETKKGLNAMVSFVIGFLVIASSQIVETITAVSSQIIILLLLSVFFLMLIGTFKGSDELEKGVVLEKGFWNGLFMAIMFIGIAFIFLDAIKTEQGISWLDVFIGWLGQYATNTAVASILLLIIVIGAVIFIAKPKKEGESR